MSESMADFEKEIDESLKTLNVVENEGESTEEETGFNAWDKVQQYLEDGTVLTLKVGGIVNKGVIVYVDGLRGFIPASHLEIGYVEDTNPYLGKTVEAKVITADPEKNRLVLSVKEVLYDKKRAEKEARINAIEAGAVLTGKVESLMPYGAFVNLGNDISGLVHISQIAQKRIESPAEVLKAGQEVNVKVLKVNTMTVKGKEKRVGRYTGKTSDWKKAIVTIDTAASEKTYTAKGGKETKLSKKYKDSIDEFMGA